MTADLDATARSALLEHLESESFDLVIIGGGITGAGALRDASARGLKVALIEADDFSAGTSSKSTKLIHGGIRYLAMGHVHVVREAALERKRVHRIAPHLAVPRWLMLPARGRLEWLKYKVGVMAYERLGEVELADRHFDVKGEAMAAHEPLINRDRFPFACVYREFLTDDSRLVIANVRAGVETGGVAANKLEVTGLVREGSRISGVVARCRLTGVEIRVKGKAVINAAGPWVESIAALEGEPLPKPLVLSKGVHIVVSKQRLPLTQMVMAVTADRRPIFMIPRGEVVYIGTTDSRYDSAAAWPVVLPEEIEYLLQPVSTYCGIDLEPADCLGRWAGLRPLISQTGKSTREISRRDEIWVSRGGLVTIAGGKLTGYRKMAEDTVSAACRAAGISAPPASGERVLPGGDFAGSVDQLAINLAQSWPMPESRSGRLVSLYGAESSEVLACGDSEIVPGSGVVEGEVHWAIVKEGAHTLEDILYRRTRAVYFSPEHVDALIDPVAALAARVLEWDAARRAAEVQSMRTRLAVDLGRKTLAEGTLE